MRIPFPNALAALAGVALLLGPAAAHADLTTGVRCTVFEVDTDPPTTDTSSRCDASATYPDPENPAQVREGTSSARSSVTTGVLTAGASTHAGRGDADAFGFARVESSLRVVSTDESRLDEIVYVTFGAPRVDVQSLRTASEPVDAGPFGPEFSRGYTQVSYFFDLFTTFSGATHRIDWSDVGTRHEAAGTRDDVDTHQLTGDLGSFTLGMMLGESAVINFVLSASADASWVGDATVTAEAYWGGITRVVDAAGRPVDYTVQSADGADWGRSYVPVAAPVPEPAAWLLGALGAFGVALGRRQAGRMPGTCGRPA